MQELKFHPKAQKSIQAQLGTSIPGRLEGAIGSWSEGTQTCFCNTCTHTLKGHFIRYNFASITELPVALLICVEQVYQLKWPLTRLLLFHLFCKIFIFHFHFLVLSFIIDQIFCLSVFLVIFFASFFSSFLIVFTSSVFQYQLFLFS